MSTYEFTIPADITSFKFQGREYDFQNNNKFGSENACEVVDFINAMLAVNSGKVLQEKSKDDLAKFKASCSSGTLNAVPQPADPGIVIETDPSANGEADSSTKQGAPLPQVGGILAVNDAASKGITTPPPPGEEDKRAATGKAHPGRAGEKTDDTTNAGDPVDVFTGDFYLSETDLEIPYTVLPMAFIRSYRSGAASYGPFGWNWDHNFNVYLRELSTGEVAVWRNLQEDIFKPSGAGFFTSRGIFEKLELVASGIYEITAAEGVRMHFERPAGWLDAERIPLIKITDRHDNSIQFTYGPDDKLSLVADDDGYAFQFDYDACGLLVRITDNSGRAFFYEHDEQTFHLIAATSPALKGHPKGITRRYFYDQPWTFPELRHNILRVEDGDGNVYIQNSYEQDPAAWSYARVTEQLYGSYLFQFRYSQLQWVPPDSKYVNIPAVQVEVMNPDFGLETYTFNYRGDLLDRRYRLVKDRSFRVVAWLYEFDPAANCKVTTKPDGSQEINSYDFNNPDPRMRGKLLSREVTSASGFPAPGRIVWEGKYEPLYQLLTEEKNELGFITTHHYDFDLTPADPGNTGKLMETSFSPVTLPDGTIQHAKTSFKYNTKGQVSEIILPDGVRQKLIYGNSSNEKSRLVRQVLDPGGLDIERTIQYDPSGYISAETDGNGNIRRNEFNALGLIEKIILPAVGGVSAAFELQYNADLKLVSLTRPRGSYADTIITGDAIIDQFKRNVLGYPTKYILSTNTLEQRTTAINPDFRGFALETLYPDGSRALKTFDERGLFLQEAIHGPDGTHTASSCSYDRYGKKTREKDKTGLEVLYEYDGFSRISKIISPNQTETAYTWKKGDLCVSEEKTGDDGSGTRRALSIRKFTYDEKGRKIKETTKVFSVNPLAAPEISFSFFYDTLDRITKIVDQRGATKIFSYDAAGRQDLIVDAMGNEEHFLYDSNSNLVQITNKHLQPSGSLSVLTKSFSYDERNRKTANIEPDGTKSVVKYDDRDLAILFTDYKGSVKKMEYNAYNNMIRETTDPGIANVLKEWKFDSMSRLISFTDPSGQQSLYGYDGIGRSVKTIHPNGFTSSRVLDTSGRVSKEEVNGGNQLSYTYDKANRLIRIENIFTVAGSVPIQPHEFTYDGLDRIVKAKAGSNEVGRTYDSLNRLLAEQTGGMAIRCSYDDSLGIVLKIWPDGRTEKLTHNLNGVLSAIEETVHGPLGTGLPVIASFIPDGPVFSGKTKFGKLVSECSYDDRKRITAIKISSSSGLDQHIKYRYDKSNCTRVSAIAGNNTELKFLEYDNLYRLTGCRSGFASPIPDATNQSENNAAIGVVSASSMGATREEKFDYNASDERLSYKQTGKPDQNYSYLPGHRIANEGTNSYSYSIGGTLLDDGNFRYEQDSLGRIVRILSGLTTRCSIEYDGFGRPSVVKEIGRPDKSFNYLGSFIEQENENGIASRQFTLQPGTGVPIAYHSSMGTIFPVFDNRYNLIALSDVNGSLLGTYRYSSFGQPAVFDASGLPVSISTLGADPVFGGQKYLGSVNLYLSRRRLMNPAIGVYLSPDPGGYKDSPSLYVYAAQNPVDNIDPDGEVVPLIVAIFVIGGALLGAGLAINDAYHHPEKYDGAAGIYRPLVATFGGAAIGAASFFGGEFVLTYAGAGAAGTTLTATETFVFYGTSSAVSGGIGRYGFNNMFPEYVDPVSGDTIAGDYIAGGLVPAVGPTIIDSIRPLTNGVTQVIERALGGNWRFFGNTGKLITNPRIKYNWKNIFWYDKEFANVSKQYWRPSRGADGKALHHIWVQNQSTWFPRGFRNSGLNLLEIPGSLNTWMGGRLGRELAFRTIVAGILALVGLGSGLGTKKVLDSLGGDDKNQEPEDPGNKHPNDTYTSKK